MALTSNTFDLGSGDNLSFGNNVQSGSTFGTSGSLTCENPPSSSVLAFYLLPWPTLICGFREFHRPIRSDNLFGFWQRRHERRIRHQLPTVTLLDSPILDSSSPLFNESLYREPFVDSPTCQAQYFLWYSEKNNQPTSTANIIIQKTGKVFSMNKYGHFLLTSPMWLPCGLFKLYLFFYFSRDKACSDHNKNMIRIGYIHKAYCIFLLYSFLVVVVRITVFPCRNKSVMWSFFNYFVVETIPRVPTYKSLSAIGITVLCDTLFCVPQNRFEIVSWNEGRHL